MTEREKLRQEAERLHEQAQQLGDADLYDAAAEKYEEARYYTPACNCRIAAMKLRTGEQVSA